MKIRVIAICLILVLTLGLSACTSSVDEQKSVSQDEAMQIFIDDAGREIEMPENIKKIVPSSPLSQLIVFAIAPDMMVGIASRWNDNAKGIIADEYLSLHYFGSLYSSADLNIEELALTDPDIIIDIGETKKSITEDLDTLQSQTQIPSVFISTDLKSMPETYRKLGKLLGREERGEELASFCERTYERTISIMEKVGDNKVNTLYVLGEDGMRVLIKDSYHSELLDMLTNNVAVSDDAVSKGMGNETTIEQILLWDPDFVIFAPDSIYDTVKEKSAWNQITAIMNDNYVEVPDAPHNWMGMPPSVQRYLGMIWLTAQLYPEYCDYDMETEIKEYYRLFYGCDLTDEQYDEIMKNACVG